MSRVSRLLAQSLALWLVLAATSPARADAPDWALQAAALPTPKLDPETPALGLLDDYSVSIDEQGTCTHTRRVAIRILTVNGASNARAHLSYLAKQDRVRDLEAWVIRNRKTLKSKAAREWTDISEVSNSTIHTDYRAKTIDLEADAAAGDVFAYEVRLDAAMLVATLQLTCANEIPQLTERATFCVPAGFRLETHLSGKRPGELTVSADGRCSSWVLQNQPYQPYEPYAAALHHDAPKLRARIVASAEATRFKSQQFERWSQVGRWALSLSQGQCDSVPALAAKARELTEDAKNDLEKIGALSRYVQQLRYVAIEKDLSKGSGYKPRKASDVFTQGYGDCKDKANLLQSMLREIGVVSYIAVANASRQAVVPEVPTPQQFNHAILAIEVGASVNLPAVLKAENHGSLLFFDATDPFVPLGQLPRDLQGTNVYLLKHDNDALSALPVIAPLIGHAYHRRAEFTLEPTGTLVGSASISGVGHAGATLAAKLFYGSQEKEFEAFVHEQLGDGLRGAVLTERQRHTDDNGYGKISFLFEKPRFLQKMPGGLALVRMDLLARDPLPHFSAKTRRRPVDLRPLAQVDELVLTLPPGLAIEELPPAASLESSYGNYQRTYEMNGKTIVLKRQVELKAQIVPVSEYADLRQFLGEISKADRATLLLKADS